MIELRRGWRTATLGDVAVVQGGIQKQAKRAPRANRYPFLRVANVTARGLDLADVHEVELFGDEIETYRLRKGDLLVVEGNGSASQIGRAAVWDGSIEDCVHQNHLIRVRPTRSVDPKFLGLVWNSPAIREGLTAVASSSSGLHTLSVRKLKQVELPIPPLTEQRRIVEILEDYLSRLDVGDALLERSRQRASAFTAALVSEALRAEDGVSVTLGGLADSVRNGIFVSRATAEVDGVPILRIGAVRRMALNLTDIGYSRMSLGDVASLGGDLKSGDLLFTRYNGNPEYVGACAVVPERSGPLTYPDKLIRVRIDRARALPEFVALACSFGDARAELRSRVKTTAGQAGISGRELRATALRLPSIDVQKRVVDRARTALDAETHLRRAASATSLRAKALRRSLLAAAFSGQLTGTPSDSEVIEATESAMKVEGDRDASGQPELQGALW